MFRTLLTSALTLSAIVAAPAIAAPAEPVSAVVSYADLNLANAVGVAALERRIKATANRICGNADPLDLVASMQVRTCRKAALASTRTQVAAISADHGIQLASR